MLSMSDDLDRAMMTSHIEKRCGTPTAQARRARSSMPGSSIFASPALTKLPDDLGSEHRPRTACSVATRKMLASKSPLFKAARPNAARGARTTCPPFRRFPTGTQTTRTRIFSSQVKSSPVKSSFCCSFAAIAASLAAYGSTKT